MLRRFGAEKEFTSSPGQLMERSFFSQHSQTVYARESDNYCKAQNLPPAMCVPNLDVSPPENVELLRIVEEIEDVVERRAILKLLEEQLRLQREVNEVESSSSESSDFDSSTVWDSDEYNSEHVWEDLGASDEDLADHEYSDGDYDAEEKWPLLGCDGDDSSDWADDEDSEDEDDC